MSDNEELQRELDDLTDDPGIQEAFRATMKRYIEVRNRWRDVDLGDSRHVE